jgi:bifunctional non-homologous end joining protein LigD
MLPSRGTKVPAGLDWIQEIKHDGYRLIVQRDGKRDGYDWSDRYPLIAEAGLRNRNTSFVIDGGSSLARCGWYLGFRRTAQPEA